MPYNILYAAVSISVQVTVEPVSISAHAIIITLPTALVKTTPVTSSTNPCPATSTEVPTAEVPDTPETL